MLTCVCVCIYICRFTGQAMGTSLESVRTGREEEVVGSEWEMDREMTRRNEKRWAPFHDGCTDQPISPGFLQERVRLMVTPGRESQSVTQVGLHHKGKHRMLDFYRKVLQCQVSLGTCYLEIYV